MGEEPVRLVTVAPGHFHAALVQKHALPGVSPHAHVYAPLDDDLLQHLARVAGFNARADSPTDWRLAVHAGADFLDRLRADRPGNTAVLSGRNRPKIDLMLAAVRAGLNVLADKPWVIDPADRPKLDELFAEADRRGLLVRDVMTERHEVTNALQRELVRDPDVFGEPVAGTADEPGLRFESVHHLRKSVAGVPLRRPWWWFDPTVAGDGIADVGTHLADLALWFLDPEDGSPPDVAVLDAERWPLRLDREAFRSVTGLADFPPELRPWASGRLLSYFGNGTAAATVRGVTVRLTTLWGLEAAPGCGDTHFAVARGTRATVRVRHDPAFGREPEVFVTVADPARHAAVLAAVRRRCGAVQGGYPGVTADDLGDRVHVRVPAALRVGHEAHFGAVLGEYLRYFRDRRAEPAWERPLLRAKYAVTTGAVEIARRKTGGASGSEVSGQKSARRSADR